MNLPRLSPRLRRILWACATLLVLYTVVGFFVLPPIARAQLVKRLSAELGRPVALGKVRLNPYALSVTLENLDVRETGGGGSFFGWRRLYVNFGALASLTGDWVLSDIALDGFHLQVTVNPDGTFNFSDLLTKFMAPPPAGAKPAAPGRALRVGRLAISDARVDCADHSRAQPFQTTVGPLSFGLTAFRTTGRRGAPYHFEAVTESGEKFVWTGTLSADPVHSAGEFSVENLNLPKYAPYYSAALRGDLAAGTLAVHGRYEVNLDPQGRVLTLSDGSLGLRNLRINEHGSGRPEVELAALDITGMRADGVAMNAGAASVALSGGHLTVRRDKDGGINLLALLPPAAATPGVAAPAAASGRPPELKVDEVALKDFKIDVADLAAPRPVQLGLGDLQCSLKNVTLAEGATMPLHVSLAWAPQGTLEVDGTVSIRPAPRATLKIEARDLAILPLSPYLEQFVNARITQGLASTSSQVEFSLADHQPAATLAGNARVERFGLVDGAHSEELAGFAALALNGLKVTTTPQPSVTLAEVAVAAPYARAIMNKDQTLNLAAVAAPPGAAAASSGPPSVAVATSASAPSPRVEIGKVTITDGDFTYTDRSLEPNVKMGVNQFGGTIAGLSSQQLGRADVDLKAAVDGVGPVAITGKLDPLSEKKFADLTITAKSVDLLPLSPYSGKFAGYEIARGKLVLDIKAKVADRRIDMANVITLNQFTFGAATNSPDATHLPVRLGVALLKDLDGKIVIDVPVEGSLDDPSLRIGKVVWRVIGNLLTKAAVSPFALLGSMFGGGGEELSYQEFAPGSTVPLPAEAGKLETLVKALTNRPGLSLSVAGNYDAGADTYALKQQKFADLVRRQVWEARRAADPNVAPPDQLTIAPEEHLAMVKKLFDAKFPPGTEFGTPLPQPPAVAPPPPAPAPGLVKRVVNVITFQGLRSRRAAEKEQTKTAEELKQASAAAVAAGLPLDVMTARLADTMEVNDNDLRTLAMARAMHVRDYLITTGKIAADRLFLAQQAATTAAKQNQGPRVFFELQ
ncbi:MAG TPA: DUF748 domain-containing protein [Opitutaceae bacterium]|nr:DUF748 domain-containing protein [Opitutaceae bacterium]